MATPPGITIYNFPPQPANWDSVGIFYVTFAATWTAIVVAGMAFCLWNQHLPVLRVRGLPLAFSAIVCLHLYWILAQIVYPIGATMPVVVAYDVQYFFMGIWFPMGIALFHASNLRFLHVAKMQRQFTHPDLVWMRGNNRGKKSWLSRIRNTDYMTKIMTAIGVGIVVQALLTFCMWLACKKYHPAFGVAGTEISGTTLPEQLIDLGRGWEWWPTMVWQFVWSWGVAPFLIWRAWNIRDTMGWRTQTIGACLSGLHATPLFLIASYTPAFYKVNAYFPPSQWFHLNTMFIEIFVIFVPVYQVIRHWHTSKRVAYSNDKWETTSTASTLKVPPPSPKGSTFELIEKEQIFSYINSNYGDRLFTMTALNRVLDEHPSPLQEFSAYHDFSGENIAFLTRVAKWKSQRFKTLEIGEEQRIDMYNAALSIYIDFVSPRDAAFPINLSSPQLRLLESIFEDSARLLCGNEARHDSATPFDMDIPLSPIPGPLSSLKSKSSETGLRARYTGEISRQFGLYVFDDAQRHVKQLVLTNTWPKFVKEMQMKRRKSEDSLRSAGSEDSAATVVSRISRFVRSLV